MKRQKLNAERRSTCIFEDRLYANRYQEQRTARMRRLTNSLRKGGGKLSSRAHNSNRPLSQASAAALKVTRGAASSTSLIIHRSRIPAASSIASRLLRTKAQDKMKAFDGSENPTLDLTEQEEILCQLLHDTCAWIQSTRPALPEEEASTSAETPLQATGWKCEARIAGGWVRDKVSRPLKQTEALRSPSVFFQSFYQVAQMI